MRWQLCQSGVPVDQLVTLPLQQPPIQQATLPCPSSGAPTLPNTPQGPLYQLFSRWRHSIPTHCHAYPSPGTGVTPTTRTFSRICSTSSGVMGPT